ncbi:MAG TPA: PAS domain S-box protein [Candidatus Dormibacteraeota bacterium]|nr:PAS domain S-box protein [Candidatus Dormibacteraeota bacterium]
MLKKRISNSSSPELSKPESETTPSGADRLDQIEKRQRELWWLAVLLLFVLSLAVAYLSWDTIRTFSTHHLEALPVGLVVLVVLFVFYTLRKTQEISEMRAIMRAMETRNVAPPTDKQLDDLFEMVSRSQQGYRDLIDSFEEMLLAFDMEGNIKAVNRSFASLLGLSFQEIVGRHISEFIEEAGGKGPELVRRNMEQFRQRRQWAEVVQIRLKGKPQVFYFDCVAHPIQRGETIHGITILARDITSLRKNEARFTELFETLQEGIYITTPDGTIVDANPALVRMLGYDSHAELLEKKVEEVFTSYEERKQLKRDVEQQVGLKGREITLLRKDGAQIICLNTAAAVRDASGKVVRYQGALMDVTERHQMQRQLHKEQEFARRLIDSFPDLILVADTARHFEYVSPRCMEILGYEVEEVLSVEVGGHTHPEDQPILLAVYNDIIEGRQAFPSIEIRMRHKKGEWRRLRYNLSPLCDAAGKIEGVVMSGRDITDMKRIEEQLIQTEKLAAMGQMLAGVAHELNNPLTAILGASELLREGLGTDETSRRQLDLTHRQARRAARIVQNLLEFSKPASPQKQPVDLNSIIDRTLQLHEHSLRSNGVSVDFQPQRDLPSVLGDPNQLIQVFLNLLTNAEQAIREIRDSGRIQIRVTRDLRRLRVTVQDDGTGIKPEILSRIFDPFYTTKRPGGGTGLGLSICASIIREHRGTIDAETLPGGGAAFTVYLPATDVGKTDSGHGLEDRGAVEATRPNAEGFEGRAVLVVDDDESIRSLLQEGLGGHGMQVDCAACADEAMQLAGTRTYDLLLCDMNLSGPGSDSNGAQVAERILRAAGEPKPTAVLITGDYVEAGETEPGKLRRLQKPFRMAEVLAIMREVIQRESQTTVRR